MDGATTHALPLRAALLASALALLSSCTEEHYHWVDVPYCEVDEGAWAGHFESDLRVITKNSGGGGVQPLHGMRPIGDVLFDAPVLVAVVECSGAALPVDLDATLSAFDETSVPPVCAGQRVVAGPSMVPASPTEVSGYDGALRFPTVRPDALRCDAGSATVGARPAAR